jgi:hypothetical protein
MDTNNQPEITLQQAIDRLARSQPAFVTFQDGWTDEVFSINDEGILTVTEEAFTSYPRPLASVVFFSSADSVIKSPIDGKFDDEDLEITVL